MKKTLLSLLAGAVFTFSGCANNAVVKPQETTAPAEIYKTHTVNYNWNGYVAQDNWGKKFQFERKYQADISEDKCSIEFKAALSFEEKTETRFDGTATEYLGWSGKGKVRFDDNQCDGNVDWIRDSTGTYSARNAPSKRFRDANKILKTLKEKLKVETIHRKWERVYNLSSPSNEKHWY
ncbi:hypothetical protein GOV03_02695 [Candidatus Woesearchaeota archaeon]|nr:hypothetical protein [Candidatus Woesearchaeota archaeon]